MKLCYTLIALLYFFIGYSQNQRDIFIKDSVLPSFNTQKIDEKEYKQVKKAVFTLEKQYGYETGLKKKLIDLAYEHADLEFFKAELTVLVRDYGFDVAYLRETESYFPAIMHGSLATWFREMYIPNHSEWLRNNFDKQIALRKLNAIHEKDQYLTSFAMQVLNIPGLDSIEQKAIEKELAVANLKNCEPLLEIAAKWKILPNDKNFAVLQTGYDISLVHNFQTAENLAIVWEALFPYIKEAYLKYQISDVVFRNYDFYHYLQYGSQVFDSFTIDRIPEQFRKDNGPIPVKDREWLENIKMEFGWE
jgi:hypothetical protein